MTSEAEWDQTEPFVFQADGRNWRAIIALVLAVCALLILFFWFQATAWIVLTLSLFTLPLIWDIATNRIAGVELTEGELRWYAGRAEAKILLVRLAHVRFDKRFDLSTRVTLVETDGTRHRLPYEALPPPETFEAAFQARGVRTERHPFSLL